MALSTPCVNRTSRLPYLSLRAAVQAAQTGEISCQASCAYYLDRIARFGRRDGLNCVLTINPRAMDEARALDAAAGRRSLPLCGAMVLVKDNMDVAGLPTTAGSIALRDNVARADAGIVRLLRRLGAVILGKTNMTEFANCLTQGMPGGFSSLGGQVVSAYGPGKDPSGSSTGSAVAMSAALCSFAVGTDTSFSVVGCAAENGVVGFKPAAGRLPSGGIVPITRYLDSAGFFTRSVEDMAYLWRCLCSGAEDGPRRRLLINHFGEDRVAPAQRARYRALLARLERAGWQLGDIPGENTPRLKELMLRRFAGELTDYLAGCGGPDAAGVLCAYQANPALFAPYGVDYLACSVAHWRDPDNAAAVAAILEDRAAVRRRMLAELEGYDAALMTGPTCLMHYAGLPSLSVPFATDPGDGMPRSAILYAAGEAQLFHAARAIDGLKGPVACPPMIAGGANKREYFP